MSSRTFEALITAAIWLVVIVVVRWALQRGYDHYERRASRRDPDEAAKRRTTFLMLRRVLVALVAAIGVWNVLSIFPQTQQVGQALLASSAVLAIFVGLAFNTPLSNLGSGMLVSFSQPLRLGDRVTIGGHTGFVEELTLIFTTLRTDDDVRVFVPNSQLTAGPIVNRTIADPRRAVTATFPVTLGSPIDAAVSTLHDAAAALPGTIDEPRILVSDISGNAAWVTARVFAPLGSDVGTIESELRGAGLRALGAAGLLAA